MSKSDPAHSPSLGSSIDRVRLGIYLHCVKNVLATERIYWQLDPSNHHTRIGGLPRGLFSCKSGFTKDNMRNLHIVIASWDESSGWEQAMDKMVRLLPVCLSHHLQYAADKDGDKIHILSSWIDIWQSIVLLEVKKLFYLLTKDNGQRLIQPGILASSQWGSQISSSQMMTILNYTQLAHDEEQEGEEQVIFCAAHVSTIQCVRSLLYHALHVTEWVVAACKEHHEDKIRILGVHALVCESVWWVMHRLSAFQFDLVQTAPVAVSDDLLLSMSMPMEDNSPRAPATSTHLLPMRNKDTAPYAHLPPIDSVDSSCLEQMVMDIIHELPDNTAADCFPEWPRTMVGVIMMLTLCHDYLTPLEHINGDQALQMAFAHSLNALTESGALPSILSLLFAHILAKHRKQHAGIGMNAVLIYDVASSTAPVLTPSLSLYLQPVLLKLSHMTAPRASQPLSLNSLRNVLQGMRSLLILPLYLLHSYHGDHLLQLFLSMPRDGTAASGEAVLSAYAHLLKIWTVLEQMHHPHVVDNEYLEHIKLLHCIHWDSRRTCALAGRLQMLGVFVKVLWSEEQASHEVAMVSALRACIQAQLVHVLMLLVTTPRSGGPDDMVGLEQPVAFIQIAFLTSHGQRTEDRYRSVMITVLLVILWVNLLHGAKREDVHDLITAFLLDLKLHLSMEELEQQCLSTLQALLPLLPADAEAADQEREVWTSMHQFLVGGSAAAVEEEVGAVVAQQSSMELTQGHERGVTITEEKMEHAMDDTVCEAEQPSLMTADSGRDEEVSAHSHRQDDGSHVLPEEPVAFLVAPPAAADEVVETVADALESVSERDIGLSSSWHTAKLTFRQLQKGLQCYDEIEPEGKVAQLLSVLRLSQQLSLQLSGELQKLLCAADKSSAH